MTIVFYRFIDFIVDNSTLASNLFQHPLPTAFHIPSDSDSISLNSNMSQPLECFKYSFTYLNSKISSIIFLGLLTGASSAKPTATIAAPMDSESQISTIHFSFSILANGVC